MAGDSHALRHVSSCSMYVPSRVLDRGAHRSPWRRFGLCLVLPLGVACAGAPPAAVPPANADDALLRDQVLDEVMAEENAKRAAQSERKTKREPAARARSTTSVRGITGSLTAFEVEQAMNTRRAELLACVAERPRALGFVAGDIAFHIDVDGRGAVQRAAIMQSTLGYAPLEECLLAVVKSAPFPVPAGAQLAETEWRMSVDPLRESAAPLDRDAWDEALEREAESTYETCEVPASRRFILNGYLLNRKLHPVTVRTAWSGANGAEEATPEQLACMAEAVAAWSHWPKQAGAAKLEFELHWVKAPPAAKARARLRKRR